MTSGSFSDADLGEIAAHGLSADEVRRQLALFAAPPPYLLLERPCTVGDGIRCLTASEQAAVIPAFQRARDAGRISKMVPASGAATRMFEALLAARGAAVGSRPAAEDAAAKGDRLAQAVLSLADGLPRFAFRDELHAALAAHGFDADELPRQGPFAPLLDHLLSASGLDYAALPKGLLKFHRYPDGARTAFEEHLVESAGYTRGSDGQCRLHFTVSPEHEGRFRARLEAVRAAHERRCAARFDVSFSVQKSSTDTVAADADNRPFRDRSGHLHFRPGGHGALIENLDDLKGDIVCVKNIDNVVPDRLRPVTIQWKQILIGVLATLQARIFEHLDRLAGRRSAGIVDDALAFAASELSLAVPDRIRNAALMEQRAFAIAALDRPLRVCGMVRNTGEPGGGPFWVRGRDGHLSLQIVESAQVDPASPEQRDAFAASTHFNPVDLVCGVRNFRGEGFDLRRYVDQNAVFIAEKSKDGRPLKALERPGLWNGAMAHWSTVFIEVPVDTFTPVKTVFDLLRPEHQSE